MLQTLRAPHPIQIPYSPLFMALREQCNALITHMEQSCAQALPSSEHQLTTDEWETIQPGIIIARVSWEGAQLLLKCAANDDDEHPQSPPHSPEHILNLSGLKQVALASDQPQAWFTSHALHILKIAQDYLVEFYRDGPTDDIPYERHLIYIQGIEGVEKPLWISNVIFTMQQA